MGVAIRFNTEDVKVYLAAAGCGKTTALMEEMTKLLDVYRPEEIAFVTFTRKGVSHGIERALLANPSLTADNLPYFRTLHSLCFRELGLKPKAMITRKDMKRFNRLIGARVHLAGSFDYQTDDDKLIARYDAIRSGSRQGVLVRGLYRSTRYERLTRAYEAFKQANKRVDFYDCLSLFRDRGQAVPVKVAFIDEAQDLTSLQWEVCRIAFSSAEKIRISGDDYQALFGYSGASPQTLIQLTKIYPTVKLETSYRLPKAVYEFASGITDLMGDKVEKDFKPAKDFEGFVEYNTNRDLLIWKIRRDLERNGYQPYRWFLLFRTNHFIAPVAKMLDMLCIPYHTSLGFCLEARALKRIKRFLNFRKLGYSTEETREKFCAKYNIKDIEDDFTESDLIPTERKYVYFSYVQQYGIDRLIEMAEKEPVVMLSTPYKVKGGEADYVALFLDCTKRVYENWIRNGNEEMRVLYVSCTRARLGLYLMSRTGSYGMDKVVDVVKEYIS
jgi:superfamily I DNA/RNA helicase